MPPVAATLPATSELSEVVSSSASTPEAAMSCPFLSTIRIVRARESCCSLSATSRITDNSSSYKASCGLSMFKTGLLTELRPLGLRAQRAAGLRCEGGLHARVDPAGDGAGLRTGSSRRAAGRQPNKLLQASPCTMRWPERSLEEGLGCTPLPGGVAGRSLAGNRAELVRHPRGVNQ